MTALSRRRTRDTPTAGGADVPEHVPCNQRAHREAQPVPAGRADRLRQGSPRWPLARTRRTSSIPLLHARGRTPDCAHCSALCCTQESSTFRFRHYSITAKQAGVNRRLRKLLTQREVPDLGECDDVADFFSRIATDASDSEGEDGANARVTLAQDFRGAGNRKGSQSTIKLQEARARACRGQWEAPLARASSPAPAPASPRAGPCPSPHLLGVTAVVAHCPVCAAARRSGPGWTSR